MSRLHASGTPSSPPWRSQLDSSRRHAAAWWAERPPRERRLLRVGALFLTLVLVWTLGLKPAIDSIARSQQQLPRLRAEAAQIDALVLEAQALQRHQPGRMDATAMPHALQTTLRRAGLEASARLALADASSAPSLPEWEIHLTDANAVHVMEWLNGLPHLLHVGAKTVELSRSRVDGRDRPGQVTGRIVLMGSQEARP